MKIITISREFGSGGRELGKRLADILGFDYYDREIISKISADNNICERDIEGESSKFSFPNVPITFRHSFSILPMYQTSTNLLIEEKKVIEKIAENKRDFIIVGRNADILLKDLNPLNIFVCASMDAKIKRCLEKANENEKLTYKELEKNINIIDKNRSLSREILTNSKWGHRENYHLTVNTTNWNIKELAGVIANFVNSWFSVNSN